MKGQAAMEYLMSYGWAILVIVVIMAMLVYSQTLSPKNPEFCQMSPGVVCTKSYLNASSDRLSITVYNSFPKTMRVVAVGCSKRPNATRTCDVALCGETYPPGASMQSGSIRRFEIPCDDGEGDINFEAGETYAGGINIRYYFGTDQDSVRIISGRVYAVAN